jgi:purine-nucleoside phosphorylase
MSDANPFDLARRAAEAMTDRLGGDHDAALVLGSGWAEAVAELGTVEAEVAMADLPGFTPPAVGGHQPVIRSLAVGAKRILVLAGRIHLYEGHSPHASVHGVRAAVLSGCPVVVLTNAAGSLEPALTPGTPVLLSDHLNLTGTTSQLGPFPDDVPSRFVDLTEAWSPRLRDVAHDVDPSLPEGVYAALLGGAYETPAEIRMLRTLGADLVGMSTVLEAIAARHLGAELLGISLVTNQAAGLSETPLDHLEVLEAGRAAGPRMVALLAGVAERL